MGKRVKGFRKERLPASPEGRVFYDRMGVSFTTDEWGRVLALLPYESLVDMAERLKAADPATRLSICMSCAITAMGDRSPTGSFPWDVLSPDEAVILKAVQNAGIREWTEKISQLLCVSERRFLFDNLSELFKQLHQRNEEKPYVSPR